MYDNSVIIKNYMLQHKKTDIKINEKLALPAIIDIPEAAKGLVIFVHGSGSGKESPRNKYIAEELNKAGFATILFDLLTEKEKENYGTNVFDLGLLSARLLGMVRWVMANPEFNGLPIGLNGASTGTAAALNAAAEEDDKIAAIVSRGGRADLADQSKLNLITARTLFIVGGDDAEVIPMNEQAAALMNAPHKLLLIPGATHIFEEPGAIEQVAEHTVAWFLKNLLYRPETRPER